MPGFDFNTLMRQVRKMQEQANAKQQELAEKVRCEGKAGDGLVTVVVNGMRELVSVKIDPKAVDPADVAMLEDLVTAAANAALAQAAKKYEEEMSKVTGGMKIPGLTI
jgi:DNA-binding YbaB/EbfC family protein